MIFLRDVWIRTQSAEVASWRATDLATHPSRAKLYDGQKAWSSVIHEMLSGTHSLKLRKKLYLA